MPKSCELNQIFSQLSRVSSDQTNLYSQRSQVQKFSERMLVDLENRANALRKDPTSDFGASYWFHLGEWVRAWVGRH